MSALSTFKQIVKALADTSMPLVCVIVITMFTISCATVPAKQTASTDTTANSITAKEKSDNEKKASAMDRLECRTVEITGSRFTRKVCEYKETWAAIDKENEEKSGEFVRKLDENSGVINPEGKPVPQGGIYNDAMTAPGGF